MTVSALIHTCNISRYILGQNIVPPSGETSHTVHKPEERPASPLALVAPGCKGRRQKQHSGVLGEVFLAAQEGFGHRHSFQSSRQKSSRLIYEEKL